MTLLSTGLLELKQQYHLHEAPLTPYRIVKRELKQQRRWRLRKRHSKSEVALNFIVFIALILSRTIRQILAVFVWS